MKTSRKEEILEVAAGLFRERGYSAVSMRDIASALDIKAASLYNHISGKQEILAGLILPIAEEFTSGMEMVLKENTSSLEKIKKLIEQQIDITLRHSEAMATVNNDWMHLEGKSGASFEKMRDDYEENFRSIIKEGIDKNEFNPVHPEIILFSILSTLRNLYLWHEKRGKLDVNILKRDMVAVLINGIAQNSSVKIKK